MFKILSDFFEKRREKELLVRAAIAERDAAQVKRAQEMINELSKIAGIESPTVIKENRFCYFPTKHEIGIETGYSSRSDDRALFAVLAHEIGHAQAPDERSANSLNELSERNRALLSTAITGVAFIAAALATKAGLGGDSLDVATLLLAINMSCNYHFSNLPSKSHMDEESRADRFAVEKAGVDPKLLLQKLNQVRMYGWDEPGIIRKMVGPILSVTERPPSPFLKDAAKRGGALDQGAAPSRIPSRFSRPPVLQEPEVTSTGRLVKPSARGPDRDYDAPEPAPERKRGPVLQLKRDR